MRAGAVIGVFLGLGLAAGALAAEAPSLTVRDAQGNPLELDLEELDFEVRFLGDVAETSITLGFRNTSDRLAEGEFVMPLPEGATVSEYALEVEGVMREAVAVEKERARFAYESITAQQVDPGIVEREEGSVYRTRIFPIPRKGVKRVRIGYVEHVRRDGEEWLYELPFAHEEAIAQVSGRLMHLEAVPIRLTEVEGLEFVPDGKARWMVKASGARVPTRPGARWPVTKEPSLQMELADGGGAWFYLSDWFPAGLDPVERPAPELVRLVWDASEPGVERDHGREFALLDAYFTQVGRTRVRLEILRNEIHAGGDFAIEGGDWSALRAVLEGSYYDGAAGFEQLGREGIEAGGDLVLLVTDGVSPHSTLPPVGKPMYVIDAGRSAAPAAVRGVARQSGGEYLDLLQIETGEALRLLTTRQAGVRSVQGEFVRDLQVETNGVAGDPVRIFGRLAAAGMEKELRIEYGVPGGVTVVREVPPGRALRRVGVGLVQRLWAQHALHALEENPEATEEGIIAHCKRYGLVSDHTSLIVLERFSDHVRYGIPPPEAELRERYEVAMREKKDGGWRRLAWQWEVRQEWLAREFPWAEVALLPRLRQVSIWAAAVERVFAKEELDQDAFGAIDAWRRQALAAVARKRELRGGDDYVAWFREVVKLAESGKDLRKVAVAAREGSPVVVSVRGLVQAPGKVRGGGDLTLAKAIEAAGGVHAFGNLGEVELYRNAGKTIYNLLSREYEDVALRPGDMIVVRDVFRSHGDESGDGSEEGDPFGEERPPVDPAGGPAVVSEEDVWVGGSEGPGDGGAGEGMAFGSDPFEGPAGAPVLSLWGEVRIVGGAVERGALAGFLEALRAGGNAEEAYARLKEGGRRPIGFYVEAARILFGEGQAGLGRQVLSNLLATPELRLDRLMACALWLEEFGQGEVAAELLQRGVRLAPEVPILSYHLARLAVRGGQERAAGGHLAEVVRAARCDHPLAALIAFTDLNSLGAAGDGPDSPLEGLRGDGLPAEVGGVLDADLRVVITTNQAADQLDLWVEEPSGHLCRDQSPCGGRLTGTKGVSEYMMRLALPGTYVIKARSPVALTVHLTIYQNWGRPNQTRKDATVVLEGGDGEVTLAEYEFGFAE